MRTGAATNVLGICPGCWTDPCETPEACERSAWIDSLPKIAKLRAAADVAEDNARHARKGSAAYYVRMTAWSSALLDLREASEDVERQLASIAAAQHLPSVVAVERREGGWWVHGYSGPTRVIMTARSRGVEALCQAVVR